jgi:glycosyltransferase involved in cell wall biosynthesis
MMNQMRSRDSSPIERSTVKVADRQGHCQPPRPKPQLEGLIVPSKFYGVAAAGRAIVAITAKNGEIAQLVEQNGCGVVVEPGDANGLAQILIDLSGNPERVAEMGRRAREMLEAHFTRRQAFERWRAVLDGTPVEAISI